MLGCGTCRRGLRQGGQRALLPGPLPVGAAAEEEAAEEEDHHGDTQESPAGHGYVT